MQIHELDLRQPPGVSIPPLHLTARRVLPHLVLIIYLGVLYPVQDLRSAVLVQLVVFPLEVFGLQVHHVSLPSVVAGSVLGVARRRPARCQAHRYDYY